MLAETNRTPFNFAEGENLIFYFKSKTLKLKIVSTKFKFWFLRVLYLFNVVAVTPSLYT